MLVRRRTAPQGIDCVRMHIKDEVADCTVCYEAYDVINMHTAATGKSSE